MIRVNPGLDAVKWYTDFARFLLSHQALAPLANALGGKALLTRDPNAVIQNQIRCISLVHQSFNRSLQDAFVQAVAAFVGQTRPEAIDGPPLNGDLAEALEKDGYVTLPDVDPDLLAGFQSALDQSPMVPDHAALAVGAEAKRQEQPFEALRAENNLAQLSIERVLALPGLLEIAADPDTIALVHRVLGAPPILINVSAWRSFAGEGGAKQAREAQLFHNDLDDYRFCKLFVYLTDVDKEGGPHVFYPTTHRPEVLAAFAGAPDTPYGQEFRHWYAMQLRKDEADVTARFGISPVEITGKAGSRFLVQTSGIHRGMPPVSQDRVLLQCTYGITPFTQWRSARVWNGFRDRQGRPTHTPKGWARYLTDTVAPEPRR